MLELEEFLRRRGDRSGGLRKQLAGAIAELTYEWNSDRHNDRSRSRLKRVVDRKRMRKTIKPPKSDDEPKAPSELTATLERTLEELHAGNCRRRSAR